MSGRRPPRLIVKTLAVTFLAVAVLLVSVMVVVTVTVREQVRQAVSDNLESSQRIFASLEGRRQRELRAQVSALAENPTLKAAIDTYQAEARTSDEGARAQLTATIQRELAKLAARIEADAILVVDARERLLAGEGRLADRWQAGKPVSFAASVTPVLDGVEHEGQNAYRVVGVPLRLDEAVVGQLLLVTSLDQRFADELAVLAHSKTAIVSDGLMIASTLPPEAARQFESMVARAPGAEGIQSLGGELYAFRRLVQVGDTGLFALASIDESSRGATRAAMTKLGYVALGATALAFLASVTLAHMLSGPIGRLSSSLARMAAARDLGARLPSTGSSLEVDQLTETFNAMMASVAAAEAETQSAYTGAIRALAAALDARDPYTAGHSDRVSVLSVAIARALRLPDADVDVIRLGALLHDIGKIGVPDGILRKPGKLNDEEFAQIRQHPVLGARILRSVPFLAPHIPIVELHHERPDGGGYPLGMRGDDIPIAAAIVHVADAYDAMTSARAYRAARPAQDALKELWRCAGTEFDAEIVGALTTALPGVTDRTESPDGAVAGVA